MLHDPPLDPSHQLRTSTLRFPDGEAGSSGLLLGVSQAVSGAGEPTRAFLSLPLAEREFICAEVGHYFQQQLGPCLAFAFAEGEGAEEHLFLLAFDLLCTVELPMLLAEPEFVTPEMVAFLFPRVPGAVMERVGGARAFLAVAHTLIAAAYAGHMYGLAPDFDPLLAFRDMFCAGSPRTATGETRERFLRDADRQRAAILQGAVAPHPLWGPGALEEIVRWVKRRKVLTRREDVAEARGAVMAQIGESAGCRATPRQRGPGAGRPRSPAWAATVFPKQFEPAARTASRKERRAAERARVKQEAARAKYEFRRAQRAREAGPLAVDLMEKVEIVTLVQALCDRLRATRRCDEIDNALLAAVADGAQPRIREIQRALGIGHPSTVSRRWRALQRELAALSEKT